MGRANCGGRQAVFLDRDGTIAQDVNYCMRPDDFHVFPGVATAIARLNHAGFLVIVVTNQSGVGRGLLTIRTLEAIHQKLRRDLQRSGARVDAMYYCPHHPDDDCSCRKPRTGLLRRAAHAFNLSLTTSYMIGDHWSDIVAGHAAGCQTVLIHPGPSSAHQPRPWRGRCGVLPHPSAIGLPGLPSASARADGILTEESRAQSRDGRRGATPPWRGGAPQALRKGIKPDYQVATLAHAIRWILQQARQRAPT